jgi:hypothetical protein
MTYVLLMVASSMVMTTITPIVQTPDAASCEAAKKVLAAAIKQRSGVEVVCLPGALVMPMDGPHAD